MSFTEPKIVYGKSLKVRSYVTFYFEEVRRREYNGGRVGKKLFPNKATDLAQRNVLLEQLRKELHLALLTGRYVPGIKVSPKQLEEDTSALAVLMEAYNLKIKADLSVTYKRDLKYIFDAFVQFLTTEEKARPLGKISIGRVEKFLSQYGSSGTYYMNKRTDLGVLFSLAAKITDEPIRTINLTERRRSKAVLHKIYELDEIPPLLKFLRERHHSLYICCLLTFSCWLRPHIEIRQLRKDHFKKDCTEIHLSGEENKGGKIRIVYIPEYMRIDLAIMLEGLEGSDNIFSRGEEALNPDYFKTAWTRIRKELIVEKLLREGQTIYSFRHTAVVELYRRTKDIYLLQKLLGHQSVITTQKYLRGLGEINIQDLIDAAPKLQL